MDVFADSDFAGCVRTRKSTSGGCILRGSHVLKHWTTTQKVVTLSSGEAELAGVVKAAAEGLGLQSLAADFGVQTKLRVHADSSAAIGVCRRSGIGRVRHLAVAQLWVQERLRSGAFSLHKVAGEDNPADLCTKHVGTAEVERHVRRLGLRAATGRAASAPLVSTTVDRTLATPRPKQS